MDHWAFQGLRRTAATEMSRLGTERFTIKRVLNHADREVTGRCDRHTHDGIKLTALDLWANRLREIVDPTPDNVIGPPAFRAVG
jgi:integrase